jgi:hypothetical protein
LGQFVFCLGQFVPLPPLPLVAVSLPLFCPSQPAVCRLCWNQLALTTALCIPVHGLPRSSAAVSASVPTSVPVPAPRPAAVSTEPTLWDSTLSFFINGNAVTVTNPDPRMHLVEYLRDVAMLKATKIGCNEGGCGACTVVLSWKDATSG